MFIIERDYRFEAARVLPRLSNEHPCSRLHGHAFGVTLVVKGELDKEKEWVVDYYEIDKIYVNRGPGSFAGIRNSLSIVKGLFLTQKIDYYCFSFLDFDKSTNIKYEDVPILCDKFKIKKNLIKPLYLS